jgi:hypothetical protein
VIDDRWETHFSNAAGDGCASVQTNRLAIHLRRRIFHHHILLMDRLNKCQFAAPQRFRAAGRNGDRVVRIRVLTGDVRKRQPLRITAAFV